MRSDAREARTGMATLPATSTILYPTRSISFCTGSELNFLPMIAFGPVIVFFRLEVICSAAASGRGTEAKREQHASPKERKSAVGEG